MTLRKEAQTNRCIYIWPGTPMFGCTSDIYKEEVAIRGRIQMNDISKHTWSCTKQVHQILGISPHMIITRQYVVRSGTWSNCWKQPMSLRVKLAKDFGSHMAEQAYHSVWKQHFPWWKYREVITHNVYMITSTGHGTIHRNLDTTRQDVQKAAVAAFRIAGFW
jgi:hypothetical protein